MVSFLTYINKRVMFDIICFDVVSSVFAVI